MNKETFFNLLVTFLFALTLGVVLMLASLDPIVNRLERENKELEVLIEEYENRDYALGVIVSRETNANWEYKYKVCVYNSTDCGEVITKQLFSVDELVLIVEAKEDKLFLIDLS